MGQMRRMDDPPSPPAPLPKGEGRNRPHPAPLPEGEGRSPQYVTFVNPEPRKGVHVFARIASVLGRCRPDISLLLVEGAARTDFLSRSGIDLGGLKNVTIMPNTPDPRTFYAVARLLLMPSLMENAGFVAMEAMSNGIPVLASNRGGLPETIGDAATTIDIPARYTPETRDVPTAAEVEPWVETIICPWDDPAEYERWSRAARERAREWNPDRLAPIYREFFGHLTHRAARHSCRGESLTRIVRELRVRGANRWKDGGLRTGSILCSRVTRLCTGSHIPNSQVTYEP